MQVVLNPQETAINDDKETEDVYLDISKNDQN